jgi:hypothetical protein
LSNDDIADIIAKKPLGGWGESSDLKHAQRLSPSTVKSKVATKRSLQWLEQLPDAAASSVLERLIAKSPDE